MAIKQRTSFGYSIISVALVLLLLGIIGLTYIQTNSLVNYFKENISVLIEIKPAVTNDQIKILKESINLGPFVKPGSLTYTSKDRGAYMLSKEFGKDLSTFGFDNPLFDILQFKLNGEHDSEEEIAKTKKVLEGNPLIQAVYIQEGMLSNINDYLRKGTAIAIAIGLLFLIVAVSLIFNTIRLSLYSNRMLIKNMQLVGATRRYIKKPYLWQAFTNGIISSMLALSALLGILLLIHYQLPEVAYLENTSKLIFLFAGLMLMGIFIYLVSTQVVIKKYLNMRIDEAY